MKILIHQNSRIPVRVISQDVEEVILTSTTCTRALWELAEKYPGEIIGWCEADFEKGIKLKNWKNIFRHDLIMASYAIETTFLPNSIGYVDQLPFVNINRKVHYPTWQMSSDIGGIKGGVLLKFKGLLGNISGFGYLLNSIAKTGQQNGLFCYSDPALTIAAVMDKPVARATSRELFLFVFQHYTYSWTSVLFWCLWKYGNKLHLGDYLKSYFSEKKFRAQVNLSAFKPPSTGATKASIDIIIPTLGRKKYLERVLKDLEEQTLPPENVIIIEQDPEQHSQSQLSDLILKDWPFKITHHFTRQTGACNARNLALDKVQSEWIFFADDDIRFQPDLLESVIKEACRYNISAVNLNCKQPGEDTVFGKIKQWGSFGAGTSMVKNSYAQKCRFSKVFEFGFGEDADFGMQLRNNGCDIIYHPHLQTLHLKAPMGGFREKRVLVWEQEQPLPKPSPTLMAYAIKHYTPEQIRGYKVSLFLKFYSRQEVRKPLQYLRQMRKRWKLSEKWANKLLQDNRLDSVRRKL